MAESKTACNVQGNPENSERREPGAGLDGKGVVRRSFLKKAALGSLAVTASAGLAEKIVSTAAKVDAKKAYLNDVVPGDKVWQSREYVTMTSDEKNRLVQMFVENYYKQKI